MKVQSKEKTNRYQNNNPKGGTEGISRNNAKVRVNQKSGSETPEMRARKGYQPQPAERHWKLIAI